MSEQEKVPPMGAEEEISELSDAELLEQAQQLAERLAEEKGQLFAQHIRLQADFDNFRKRSRLEREDFSKLATAGLIQQLLPVLDNFERAVSALQEAAEREGVQLIYRQFLEVLAVAGLTPIEAVGSDFDPQIHEAVAQAEAGEENRGKVLAEALKGYMLNGKLLRAAQVQVGC